MGLQPAPPTHWCAGIAAIQFDWDAPVKGEAGCRRVQKGKLRQPPCHSPRVSKEVEGVRRGEQLLVSRDGYSESLRLRKGVKTL